MLSQDITNWKPREKHAIAKSTVIQQPKLVATLLLRHSQTFHSRYCMLMARIDGMQAAGSTGVTPCSRPTSIVGSGTSEGQGSTSPDSLSLEACSTGYYVDFVCIVHRRAKCRRD